ncbi:MAG TPA: aminotransferase class I/II-fold pyridoxal phosphate-dependent enzyme [Fimbriimonadaceae bacterium]|nr:aminotransferase class I/II-fold pyridoxal phosphate-dependent enzyme [Fimbriimonadaceae bacterium]
MDDLHFDTLYQHIGEEHKPHGAVVPPIFQNSLFVFPSCKEFVSVVSGSNDVELEGSGHAYSRISNPTVDVVLKKLALLEGTEDALVFGSGMGAISAAILSCVQQGSHIVCLDTCYGPTRNFIESYLPKFGVSVTFVDGLSPESVHDAIKPETTLVYLESPSSIIFRIQDLEAISSQCRAKGIPTIIDNSYSSPVFQQPAKFGIDMVVHSATKYLCGHSDVVAGAFMGSKERTKKIIDNELQFLGAILPPLPAWLMLRGLRTLKLRVPHHGRTAHEIATWLRDNNEVEEVFHVGFAEGRQRELFEKQMSGTGGLVTFQPKNQDPAYIERLIDGLKLFQLGVSWGGFESLGVPIHMKAMGWSEHRYLVRLYCGLEDPRDMKADLERAFNVARG